MERVKNDHERALRKIARMAIMGSIKKGNLPPAKTRTCSICGERASSYHHADYNKPMEVIPVCFECHGFIHRREKTKYLLRLFRDELEAEKPSTRMIEQQSEKIRIAYTTKWSLRDMLNLSTRSRLLIEEVLWWIVDEYVEANLLSDDDSDECIVSLHSLSHGVAKLARCLAAIEQSIIDARAGIYNGPMLTDEGR